MGEAVRVDLVRLAALNKDNTESIFQTPFHYSSKKAGKKSEYK
jgi:hypothetical protein